MELARLSPLQAEAPRIRETQINDCGVAVLGDFCFAISERALSSNRQLAISEKR